jgi:hypothetical protein
MEILCPECLGSLTSQDGQSARCTTHGGKYAILFTRSPLPATPAECNPTAETSAAPPGVVCVQHPTVSAARQCKLCGAFMCATCDFELPGGIHVCPTCATTPKTTLSPRRKKLLFGAYALAVWSTLCMGILLSGALTGMVQTKAQEEVLGFVLILVVLAPSIAGLSLGFGAMDRRLVNPACIWIGILWNGVILGVFLLLCVVGSFR